MSRPAKLLMQQQRGLHNIGQALLRRRPAPAKARSGPVGSERDRFIASWLTHPAHVNAHRTFSVTKTIFSPEDGQGQEPDKPGEKASRKELLKQAVKDYGSTVVVFHVAISLASLGGFYTAVSSGLDIVALLNHIPYIGEKLAASDFSAKSSTFVIAYAVHKVFAPVRISITLTSTPFIVMYLRRKGILKAKVA